MKRSHYDYRRDARDIAVRILTVVRDLDAALASLRDGQPGYPTSSGAAGAGGPSLAEDGTPPGLSRFVIRRDAASHDLRELDELLEISQRHVAQIHRIVSLWSAPPRLATDVHVPAGQGECVACGFYCSGADRDRLRAGLCDTCRKAYQRWTKENGPDRFRWLTAKRAEKLAEQIEAS